MTMLAVIRGPIDHVDVRRLDADQGAFAEMSPYTTNAWCRVRSSGLSVVRAAQGRRQNDER
jgi:hypothetical protein